MGETALMARSAQPHLEFKRRPDRCPCCGRGGLTLDYHHWRYGEDEQGVYLCRGCHTWIHCGGAQPSKDADWLAECIANLCDLHVRLHGDVDATEILVRYNLPAVEPLVEAGLEQTENCGRPS